MKYLVVVILLGALNMASTCHHKSDHNDGNGEGHHSQGKSHQSESKGAGG